MNKDQADKIISDYVKKIYSFSLSKLRNIDKAEELASRITVEVYLSLLKADSIQNINAYIYRIARNVYAQFIMEEKKEDKLLNGEIFTTQNTPLTTHNSQLTTHYSQLTTHYSRLRKGGEVGGDDNYQRLRKEISFLSNLQRHIVVLYYYQKLNTEEIAKKLKLPRSTIKWHLIDARNQLKEGFKTDKDLNSQKEIIFNSYGSYGKYGLLNADMSYFYLKIIPQKITYSVFHKAKTSIEIAKELSIPTAYIEDEIKHLYENGFLIKLPGEKYFSNVYIVQNNKNYDENILKICELYAKKICDIYIPILTSTLNSILHSQNSRFYVPQNDYNFLFWSIFTFATIYKFQSPLETKSIQKYLIKPFDGGEFLAFAEVSGNSGSQHAYKDNKNNDIICEKLKYGKTHISAWWFNSNFDVRVKELFSVGDILGILAEYIAGNCPKDIDHIDDYMSLYDADFLLQKGDDDFVNTIITTLSMQELIDLLPEPTEEIRLLEKKLVQNVKKARQNSFPPYFKKLICFNDRQYLSHPDLRVAMLQYLLDTGVLKPLKQKQKKTVNMIVFNK